MDDTPIQTALRLALHALPSIWSSLLASGVVAEFQTISQREGWHAWEADSNGFLDFYLTHCPSGDALLAGVTEVLTPVGSNPAKPLPDQALRVLQAVCAVGIERWILEVMGGKNPARSHPKNNDCLEHPVEDVSWQDAQKFNAELSRLQGGTLATLPTEAEWEYACRAGTAPAP